MKRIHLALVLAALLGACVHPPVVQQPMSARTPPPAAPPSDGAIFHAGYRERPLFEDRRARGIGDTMTIVINEKTSASKKAESSVSKTGSSEFSVPLLKHLPGKSFLGAELEASNATDFNGGGESSADNAFTGTIAVTVIDVLPNGNLLVSGEKQIALNHGEEFIRFSGVVDPVTISGTNSVSSTRVADARIEYRQHGYINEAQIMGWLGRFFLTFLPF